jgi:hypothetical protein
MLSWFWVLINPSFDRTASSLTSIVKVSEDPSFRQTVASNSPKRRLSVLKNLYSGTFERLATHFPSILQVSLQKIFSVTHKTVKSPLCKGLEVRPTAKFNPSLKFIHKFN